MPKHSSKTVTPANETVSHDQFRLELERRIEGPLARLTQFWADGDKRSARRPK